MRDKIPCGGFYIDDTLKIDGNGKLGLAPGAGNDETELFKVAITVENNNITSDKTFAEIQEAFQAGKYIYALIDGASFFSLLAFIKDTVAVFGGLEEDIYSTFVVTANNNIIFEDVGALAPVPNPAANGQFVQVVNGHYELSSDIIIPSSTSGSSKKFKITVDDSGNLSTTEVT